MNDAIRKALATERRIDITTTGRTSGKPHRMEIFFHSLEDAVYISGHPGHRDWYANLLTEPRFTFHLKESIQADIAARATPIHDPVQRRDIITRIHQKTKLYEGQLEAWVQRSPLVLVDLEL